LSFADVEVAAVDIKSMSSVPIFNQAWNFFPQSAVGEEQGIHSGSCYSREMPTSGQATILRSPF